MSQAPINSNINLGIPANTPDQFDNDPATKAVVEMMIGAFQNFLLQLEQWTGITQKDISLWTSLTPTDTLLAHQPRRIYKEATLNIAYGDLIQITNVAGVAKVRLANAAAGVTRRAHGFCSTTGGVLAGAVGEFILMEGLLPLVGVVPGQTLFLSAAAAGKIVAAAPVGVGQLEQTVGFGVDVDLAYIHLVTGTFIQH